MAGRFEGKVVMVTGAAGAVSDGVVRKFAAEGAKLVLADYSEDKLNAQVAAWGDLLNAHMTVLGDLGKPEDVDAALEKAVAQFGQIDVLAHVAGGFAMGDPVHEADISVLEKMLYLNTRITYLVMGKVAKHMVDHGVKGSLIGVVARPGEGGGAPNMAAYAASKAAVQTIIKSMAAELKAHDIRVNGLSPSIVDTPANRADMGDDNAHKWVTPAQIGDLMLFLASEAATAISGQVVGIYNKA